MVRAANGDETLTGFNIFRWYERLREGGKRFKTTRRMVAPLSLERKATWKGFCKCYCKIVTCHFEWQRMSLPSARIRYGRLSLKVWKKESLLALCTACIDCGTERYRLAACEDLIEKAVSDPDFFFKRNWRLILVLCLRPSDETTVICMGWRKLIAATQTSIPEVSREDNVGYFLRLAGSRAQRIFYRKDRLLALNSTEKWWIDFWKDFGALCRTRLNQVAGSCSTIMPLHTTQLSTTSFSQIKALLFFVTPLLLRFGTCGLLSIP